MPQHTMMAFALGSARASRQHAGLCTVPTIVCGRLHWQDARYSQYDRRLEECGANELNEHRDEPNVVPPAPREAQGDCGCAGPCDCWKSRLRTKGTLPPPKLFPISSEDP